MTKDPFQKAPEFLAAFSNIVDNGFFEELSFNVSAFEGHVGNCTIRVVGLVPNDKKYAAEGCGVLISPEEVIERLRALVSTRTVKSFFVEVKTEDWPLWDEEGEKIIGSKGTKSNLVLTATFQF